MDADVMTPAQAAAQRTLQRNWRSFHDVLSPPGFDWSVNAHRRVGWSGARRPAMGAAAARGASALAVGGPPDTIRIAFLRVDFRTDRGGSASTGDGHFETQVDTVSPPIDRPPRNRAYFEAHGEALSRYYDAQTYGRVVVKVDVWPRTDTGAYSVSDMADFGPWLFSPDIYPAAVHMMRTMFFAADSQSIAVYHDRVPWDSYDRFVIIHAGSDLQSDYARDSKEDIPSFTVGVSDTNVIIFPDSTQRRPITSASIIPETITQDMGNGGLYGVINGVLAHECGHLMFGFFDVYDIETGGPVVGFWSLMDSGNLVAPNVSLPDGSLTPVVGLLPPSIDPFQRAWTSDAITLPPLDWDQADSLRDDERHPDIRRLDLTADEYLLLENRYQTPSDSFHVDQDSVTHVILGPRTPDRFEYDALLPGGGVLIWHVDASVIPLESAFPLDTALRVNPDFGLNSNPDRRGLSVIEADGLGDLGDPSSLFIEGSPTDPWFLPLASALGDSTIPNLIPHIGTRTHTRIEVLDSLKAVMRVRASRTWAMAGWPRQAPFYPGGAKLLAVDADGDDTLDVCWAGGTLQGPDSTGLFAMRPSGQGLYGTSLLFASLDRRPNSEMAAIATGATDPVTGRTRGPALFAVTTLPAFPGDTQSGKLWLVDQNGSPQAGFPPALPSPATTPPVIAGTYPNALVLVGCADGYVRGVTLGGALVYTSATRGARAISGRLAARLTVFDATAPGPGQPPHLSGRIAAGVADGTVFSEPIDFPGYAGAPDGPPWSRQVGGAGFAPDFVWLVFGGSGAAASPSTMPWTLVVRDADRLYAFRDDGTPLSGWGRSMSDTLVAALGAGDADGDGYPEVLVQTLHSGVAFVNASGGPTPGWPKRTTAEDLISGSPALAADVDGDGRCEVVAMSGTGIIAALRGDGRQPPGWPLASGAGATGSPLLADLDGDGFMELVAADNVDRLWGYSLPMHATTRASLPWPMLGGDPGRTCTLPLERTPVAQAPSAGPLVGGTLKAYPNPAVRKPVTFAYTLTEPAHVEFRVLDTSGHQVSTFSRDGQQAENLVTWDPSGLPAGLYLVQVRFTAGPREARELLQVGVLR